MSRSGSKRSIAPISPSRPYETRSFSSTCAGSPLPSRPATYLTSGAYVRISRSRTPWSFDLVYSRQRAWVSSCATRREYDSGLRSPQIPYREGQEPERDHARRDHHDDQPELLADGLRGLGGDAREAEGEDEKERAERGPGRRRCHAWMLDPPRLQSARNPRGVAQLAEHRSPKPGVAGSSPAAPVGQIKPKP